MINKSDIGKTIKFHGDRYLVLSFECFPFSDLGCGPVIDVTRIELRNVETGEIVTLEWED